MSTPQVRYQALKLLTITLGAGDIILATYIGFLLGVENYGLAMPLIGAEIVLTMVDSWICFWVWEHMYKRG